MATHSSTLAWKIPWTEEPGGLHAVHGVAKSRTRLSDFTFTFHFHALEKEMATHSCVLAWGIPGTGEPGGLPSIGSHKSDTTEATQQQQHTHKQVLTWDVRTTCHFSEHCWWVESSFPSHGNKPIIYIHRSRPLIRECQSPHPSIPGPSLSPEPIWNWQSQKTFNGWVLTWALCKLLHLIPPAVWKRWVTLYPLYRGGNWGWGGEGPYPGPPG